MITLGDYSFHVATRADLLQRADEFLSRTHIHGQAVEPSEGRDSRADYTLTAVAQTQAGGVVGVARLILDSPMGLPAARAMSMPPPGWTGRFKPAELDPPVLDPEHRQGVEDIFAVENGGTKSPAAPVDAKGDGLAVTRGLLMALSEASVHLGVTHWCLMTHRKMWHLLMTVHVPFEPVAPETDYLGRHTPYLARVEGVEAGLVRSSLARDEAGRSPDPSIATDRGESRVLTLGGFRFFVARTEPLLEAVYHLRYRVFVDENDFDPPELYPDKRLRDRYDAHSFVVAAMDRRGEVVGTLRVIQNSPEGLPCLNWADPRYPDKTTLSRRVGELSRLALSREHSRYINDVFYSMLSTEKKAKVDFRWDENPGLVLRERRKSLFILYGLFRVAYDIARWLRLTTLHMVADPRLRRVLESRGLHPVPIGPRLNVGPRGGAPHAIRFQEIETVVRSLGGVRELARAMARFVPPALTPERADIRLIQ